MNTVEIDLDISKGGATPQVVTIGQGDRGGTTIAASVFDGGDPVDLTGKTAMLEARLPDGQSYVRDINCTCEGNVVTYKVDEEHVAAIAGITDDAYFDILEGPEVVYSTNRFRLEILRSAHDGAVPVKEWDNAVDALIDRGRRACDAYDAAEAVRESNESARESAEDARKTAETARANAEDARAAAESARATAEASRATAEGERVTAESARADAETARSNAETARATAETAREQAQGHNDSAQQQNNLDQLKNNSDQALNNQAAKALISVVLTSEQYDATTRTPTITGEIGKIYLVPKTDAKANDHYLEWMWLNDAWEQIGSTQTTIEGVTTNEVDSVVDDEEPTGNHVLSLTGLTYLWGKLKDYMSTAFSEVGHKHSAADVTSGTLGVSRGGTGASTAAAARTNLGVTAANVVDGNAITPSSVTATGAVKGSSVSDSVGSLADLRDSVSRVTLDGVDSVNLIRTPSGTCCLDYVVSGQKYRLQWRNSGIGFATFINGRWTDIWSK